MVVGVTGGIGSGKTTIVKMFAKFKNVAIYFADDEAKKIMNSSIEIREKLIENFSENVFIGKKLNTSFLASIVFNDKKKLAILNNIVHPVVHHHFKSFVKKNEDKKYVVYENAILFENNSHLLCDKIITVYAPLKVKVQRVVLRDNVTSDLVEKRMRNQWPDMKKIIQSHYVINNLMLNKSELLVSQIHNKLTQE